MYQAECTSQTRRKVPSKVTVHCDHFCHGKSLTDGSKKKVRAKTEGEKVLVQISITDKMEKLRANFVAF